MKKPKPHGGKRKGAGRPVGSTNATHKADPAVTRSVSMPTTTWDRLDTLRGKSSRGSYIKTLLP